MKFILFLLLIPFVSNTQGEQKFKKNEIYLDATKIEEKARLINLRFDPGEKAITLDNTELIEDDAPAVGIPEKYFGIEYRKTTAPWQEDLCKGVVLKKILILNDPRAWSGRLLFLGGEKKDNLEPLHISINGHHFIRPASLVAYPYARQYIDVNWLRWYFIGLPLGALKKGANEILLWSESEAAAWKVCLALDEEFKRGSLIRRSHPNRSQKSSDGGITWQDLELGIKNSEDGEYTIRLSLDRYVPTGEFVSPVIDLIAGYDIVKNLIQSLTAKYFIDIETPENTKAIIMIRFGSSPLLNDKSWSSWNEVKNDEELTENLGTKRYIQWKAVLSTSDPLKSPLIRGIQISSQWQDISVNEKSGIVASVVHNGEVITPSYLYSYEDLNHPELQKFRDKFGLDKIIEGADSEFELMMRLLHWSYRIPVKPSPYSWNYHDFPVYKKGENGMPELQWDYQGRRRDAMCLLSNLALQGALLSLGYQARFININSEAASGHEITEVWSNEFNKWFYLDATRDYYYYDPDTGIPMNLLEIHNKLAEKLPRIETWQRPFVPEIGPKVAHQIKIGMRQGDNPVSIVEDGFHILEIMGYFRILLRNDFLSHPLPIPIAQGYTMWGWDGYLNHYDQKFPKRTEFQRQSNRFIDFYQPLNQSEIILAETSQKGILKVEVNTFTPGFEVFLVRIDDGQWTPHKYSTWQWQLRAGMNKIEVRVRNIRGVLGPVSCVKVIYNP